MRRQDRERILRHYSHYGFLWKQGRKTPNWKYRVFELRGSVLSYWVPTKEISMLVTRYTKALETSRLKERDDLKIRLQYVLSKVDKLSSIKLNESTEIGIPQNSGRHFPTTNRVPTYLSFEIVVHGTSPRRLLCCPEERSSRQLWLDLIKTRTRSSLDRVVEQIIDPRIRIAMRQNKIKNKKIESLMDPTSTVICDDPMAPTRNRRILSKPRSFAGDVKCTSVPNVKLSSKSTEHLILERRPESLPGDKVPMRLRKQDFDVLKINDIKSI